MNQTMKLFVAAVLLVGAMGYLAFSLLSSSSSKPELAKAANAPTDMAEAPRVATLVTDPFFHPAVQQVLPAGASPDPLKGSLQPMPSQAEPLQPFIQGPIVAYPNRPQGPGALPGQIPSRPAASDPVVEPPVALVKITLQGLVVGERPAAFLRIDDSACQKVMAGSALKDGITVLEISDKHVTLSRKGKTLTLLPGQSENL